MLACGGAGPAPTAPAEGRVGAAREGSRVAVLLAATSPPGRQSPVGKQASAREPQPHREEKLLKMLSSGRTLSI